MADHKPQRIERRASARWDHLSQLTGIAIGARQTGWDRLTQAILDDPAVRLRAVRRIESLVNLCRLLTRLKESHFVVVALRYGLTVDDQAVPELTRRAVSEKLQLSMSRIAQIEDEAINDLRQRAATEFPSLETFIYRASDTTTVADIGDRQRQLHVDEQERMF